MPKRAKQDRSAYIVCNRRFWDADADAYQEVHGDDLAARPLAWGAWRRPEAELRVLDDVTGRDVLELGCGAAQWSHALARLGARAVGLDISAAQLRHARRAQPSEPILPFVLADAEHTPFAAASFDVVFCDHGAMSFCNPAATVPEVARVLRPRGVLAFCVTHPLVYLTWDRERERQSRKLHTDYDGLGCIDFGDGTIDWVLPPSEWMHILRTNGFDVERLVELRPPAGAKTTYDLAPTAWARRWPAEQIWRARLR